MRLTGKILFLVTVCLFVVTTLHSQKELSLEDAVMKQWTDFYPDHMSQLQWIEGWIEYVYVEDDKLIKNTLRGDKIPLIDLEELNSITGLELSGFPRITKITEKSFTFQTRSGNYLFDYIKKSFHTLLSHNDNSAFGELSHSGKAVSYMIDNDLYVLENGQKVRRVTENPGHIVSGAAYARQEFGIVKGQFWSPDDSMLAFYQKDESNVADYPLTNYNTVPASIDFIKYPMAGGPSEIPSVGVYNIKTGKTTFLNLENGKKDDSFYATNLAWSDDNKYIFLAIVQRDQKSMKLKMYDANTGEELRTLFEEKNDRYVEPENPIIQVPGKEEFLWFSERDGFNNLYHYKFDGTLKNQTKLKFPITRFLKFTNNNKYFFVMATGKNATENHLYKVPLKSMKAVQVTKVPGQHRVGVSDDGSYILDDYSSIDIPNKVDLLQSSGKMVMNLHSAEDPLEEYDISKPEIFELESFDGTPLWCRMIKPSNFDPNKRYPVLVYVYNGPHVQLVRNSYLGGASLWMYKMAEDGYIVFTVDGRGSANRGFDFESSIHRQVGETEVEDQEFCVNWLKSQKYTNPDKFAVHGWSYGGFMTTSLMLKRPGLFEVGVGGGPVIDWRFYEVMYTERYMDTPQDNEEGFEQADLKNHVDKLAGDLLLIHGVIDDVVVMQHNLSFQKACIDQGVQIDFYAYPGHPHNVRGKDRVHLMTKVLDYIKENLED